MPSSHPSQQVNLENILLHLYLKIENFGLTFMPKFCKFEKVKNSFSN